MEAAGARSIGLGGRSAESPFKRLLAAKGLITAPIGIAGLAVLLYYLVNSRELTSVEERNLSWSVVEPLIIDHLYLTLWSTVFVIVIAVPLGILLTRPAYRKLSGPVLAVATSGQALPAYGLVVLAFALMGRGQWSMIWALVLFALLPVLRNTMVGLEQVDAAVIEAGRGMGLTKLQALTKIELPLAVPVILAGVRTALVINVGMATLGFLIGAGGLGVGISSGIKLSREFVIVIYAGLTAVVALGVDWVAAIIERVLRPKGL
jgi:osmoprotectant transport system permease protein